jgi:hypothetical protein
MRQPQRLFRPPWRQRRQVQEMLRVRVLRQERERELQLPERERVQERPPEQAQERLVALCRNKQPVSRLLKRGRS